MKKTLALVLSAVLLLTATIAVIPFSVTADTAPIKATPLAIDSVATAVNVTIADAAQLFFTTTTGKRITVNGGGDFYSVNTNGRGDNGIRFNIVAGSKVNKNDTHFMFRYEANGKSTISPMVVVSGSWYNLKSGATVKVLKDGGAGWETKTTTETTTPQIVFGEAFSGYVKIAYSDFDNSGIPTNVDRDISRVDIYTYGMGTVGGNTYASDITVGTFFTVASDSDSTQIEVPSEYRPRPIDATPIIIDSVVTAINATVTDANPLSFTTAIGKHFTLNAGGDFYSVNTNGRGDNGIRFNIVAGSKVNKNDTHFMFRYEANDKSTISPMVVVSGSWYNLKSGATVKVLKDGGAGWETKTTTETTTPQIVFGEAFSGYVKIAYSDFDNSGIPTNVARDITRVDIYTHGMGTVGGNTYASDITVGAFYSVSSDSSSTEINVPDEFKTRPIKATPIVIDKLTTAVNATVADASPLAFTTAVGKRVVINSGGDFYGVNTEGRGTNGFRIDMVSGSQVKQGDTHFMFRYEASDKSTISPMAVVSSSWYNLKSGATVKVLKDGAAGWETKATTETVKPQIVFDEAFSGYIKIAYSDFDNSGIPTNVDRDITRVDIYTYGMGTVGENTYASDITIGAFYTVNSDSGSTEISIPDEFKRKPFDATPLVIDSAATAAPVTVSDADPLFFATATGKHITLNSGRDFYNVNSEGRGSNGFRFNMASDSQVNKDDTYFIFRYEANGKSTISPMVVVSGSWYNLKSGATVKVLKDGSTYWQTNFLSTTTKPQIEFNDSFSGYIKIAYSDFDNKGIPTDKARSLTRVDIYTYGMGTVGDNSCATDITVGPFFTSAEAELPPSADTPVDPRPNGPAENYLNSLSATPINSATLEETTDTIKRKAVYPLAGFPSAVGCQIIPINPSGYETQGSNLNNSKAKAIFDVNSAINGQRSVVVYVKALAGNSFLPQVEIKNPSNTSRWNSDSNPFMTFEVGTPYEYLPAGSDKWSVGTAIAGVPNSSVYGAIKFENDFEGYIKLPLETLVNDKGFTVDIAQDEISRLHYSFAGVGGQFGQAVAGPSFLLAYGESGYRKVTVPDGATLFDVKPSIRAVANLSAQSDYVRAGKTVLQGYKINGTSDISGGLPYDKAGILLLNLDNKYTGSDYLTFYIDLPGANKLGVAANRVEDNYDVNFMEGRSYEVLPDGATEWVTKTSTRGKNSGNAQKDSMYGALEFDSAFKGWVKLPYTSFSYSPKSTENFQIFRINFSRIGGSYGEVQFGPFATMQKPIYIAPNVWDKSKLPEMKPFDPATEVMGYSYYGIAIEEVPSPIPSLSTNKGFYISCTPSINLETLDCLKSPYAAYQKFNEMPIGNATHIMMYVKIPKSRNNELTLSIWTNEMEYKIMKNSLFALLPLGSNTWQHYYTTDPGIGNWGTFGLPAGFEGFLKIPMSTLQPAKTSSATKIKSIGYRFSYLGAETERSFIGPLFLVTKDNDPGPAEVVLTAPPTATTILRPYVIEPCDIFPDKIMLSWQPYEGAKEYTVDAYLVQKGENGKTYKLVKSVRAFTNSATVTGLEPDCEYALVVNAVDANRKVFATYAYILARTSSENMYVPVKFGGTMPLDGVLYPSSGNASTSSIIGNMSTWKIVAISAAAVVVLAAGAIVTVVLIKKRRKTNA